MDNTYIVLEADQNALASLNWKNAQGSSLSEQSHDKMKQGQIICVDKSPCKIKFFRRDEEGIKSICFPANSSITSIINKNFGSSASLEKVEEYQKQEV